MSGFDQGRVWYHEVLPESTDINRVKTDAEDRFADFVREFRIDNNYIYRDQLRKNCNLNMNFLEVNLSDLLVFDDKIADYISNSPTEYIPIFENSIARVALQMNLFPGWSVEKNNLPSIELNLLSNANPIPMRELEASAISKLVRIPGLVISAAPRTVKATSLRIACRNCRHETTLRMPNGLGYAALPRNCEKQKTPATRAMEAQPGGNCGLDPYVIVGDKCAMTDVQVLKLQEAPDMVPVGELPRHMMMIAHRRLTDAVMPGSRVTVIGIYDIFERRQQTTDARGVVAIRHPYIRVVGLQRDSDAHGRLKKTFTEAEESAFLRLARTPDLYEKITRSIAPNIYGYTDIKRAVACLLIGGSCKVLPDNVRLRGDINVLLLGDPGTAKSQMLKFVEKVAPIAVYTSGKGSSAAGLTASVIRDATTGEFHLEGGAMVLADGGVVCIDEFDKMRLEDRVAIHEAMEQQTISIAKAGITTVLNSRTSVLAAANPVFGRYDDMRTPGENIDFQSTILSRFDAIFIVKDDYNEERDLTVARHVIQVHRQTAVESVTRGDIDLELLRKYVAYCRMKCAPRLTAEACEKLSHHFVTMRSDVRRVELEQAQRSSIPITIRQLEAIVRLSESLAKMALLPFATEQHVDEALRLFKVSTLEAVHSGQMLEGMTRPEMMEELNKVETQIRRRLAIGSQTSEARLLEDLVKQGFVKATVERTILVMLRKEELQHLSQQKILRRLR